MRVLLRQITRRGKGASVSEDRPLDGSRFTIGRGADQTICLPNIRVALQHAVLSEGADGRVHLQSSVPSGFRHNEEVLQSADISAGDTVQIGGYELRFLPGSGPYRLTLEVEELKATKGKELEEALLARSRMTLASLGIGKRPISWALCLGIFGLFFLIPLLGFVVPPVGKTLRAVPGLPSDHVWNSGPMSNAHQFFAGDCGKCHEQPFVMTRNEACLDCHRDTPQHVAHAVLGKSAFGNPRCGSCHHEHTGGQSLVRHDEALCVDCHRDIKRVFTETKLENVRDFSQSHPQFRASLVRFEGEIQRVERVSLDDHAKLKETSNLVFSHKAHLKKEGVRSPARGIVNLACADCHVQEPGGGLMQPVSFEQHCHECHQLAIPGDIAREAPHGNLAAALGAIDDYFDGWALRGGYPNLMAPQSVQERRRPGVELSDAERKEAVVWARETAELAKTEMLEFTACATCHQARRDDTGWHLPPVHVATQWFPKSQFSHARHDTLECRDCHKDVAASSDEGDVLMQGAGIESCRTCHADGHAAGGKVASTCIDCHGFHIARDATFTR